MKFKIKHIDILKSLDKAVIQGEILEGKIIIGQSVCHEKSKQIISIKGVALGLPDKNNINLVVMHKDINKLKVDDILISL